MKRKIFTLFCCLMSLYTWAQKHNATVPNQIAQQFSKRFGDVRQVEWIAATDENYEAKFYEKGVKKTALFSNSGQWLVIENTVKTEDLPSKVNQSLQREFAGYQIGKATRMELFGKGVAFRVRVIKGKGIFDVEIDVNGRVGRRVEVREETHHHHHDCHHCHHHDKHKHKQKHKHKHDDCDDDDDDDDE